MACGRPDRRRLPSLPAGVRRYAQGRVYRRSARDGPGSIDAPAVERVLADVAAELGAVAGGGMNEPAIYPVTARNSHLAPSSEA